MGKGNRNSRQRAQDQLANEEKLLAKENANKNKKNKDRLVSIACIVIALLVVAVLVLNVLSETGVFIRAQKAMYIDGQKDMTVNAAMMTYYVNNTITTWYNQYYAYVLYGLISVDLNSNLRTQKLTSNDANYMGDSSLTGKTWYDYFMQTTMENVEMYLTYANAGKNIAECDLTDEDRKEIDEAVHSIKDSLKDSQLSIADQYGKGVTEGDIRDCYELMYRASNFADYLRETEEERLKGTEEVITNYREDNKGSFYSAEYLKYSINVSEKTSGTQLAYDLACADAKLAAEKIAAATTPEEFVQYITLYEKDKNAFIGVDTETSTDTEEASAEEASAEETESETEKVTTVEELVDKYSETVYYETNDELGEWIFEETAETYDVHIEEETETELGTAPAVPEIETEETTGKPNLPSNEEETTEDGKIVYEKYTVTVYMLTEKPSVDNSLTHNIAYVITDNKAAAEKFMAEFLKADKKDRDTFVSVAENCMPVHDHTEEEHEEPIYSYDNVDRAKEKYFNDDYKLINDWIEDEARKNGDYTDKLIEINVTSGTDESATITTYYAAVVFEGHDREAWYADALSGALTEALDEWYENAKKAAPVIPNNDVIDGLMVIGG